MYYADWVAYLKKAKNGMDRPIHGSITKRVLRGPGDSVRLRLHHTDVVTLHSDGSETIRTGDWNAVTTKRFLSEHSKARVWSEKGQLYVAVRKPKISKPRVMKCRRCNGTGAQLFKCHGPGWCYAWYGSTTDECEHGKFINHRHEYCVHGRAESHLLPPAECWQCHGEGKYDYGSKEIHHAWAGDALNIDYDGYAIPTGPGSWTASPPPPVMPPVEIVNNNVEIDNTHNSGNYYGDSAALLRGVLPNLSATVSCPHCSEAQAWSLENAVIHLNDSARWTREQIADWLETLDIDLSFPVPDTIPDHIH